MLQATAEANTRNAAQLALKKYAEAMDREVCPSALVRVFVCGFPFFSVLLVLLVNDSEYSQSARQ